MRFVEVRRPQQQPLTLQRAGQVFLGERRALIRQPGLIADQDDLPGEALAPQRIDGLDGRLAAAHDDDPFVHCSSLSMGANRSSDRPPILAAPFGPFALLNRSCDFVRGQ